MLDLEPIGEVILKNVDHNNKSCALRIHLKFDSFKNKGYGTHAEIPALQYAFTELGMKSSMLTQCGRIRAVSMRRKS